VIWRIIMHEIAKDFSKTIKKKSDQST
jgi:hypothetical protein